MNRLLLTYLLALMIFTGAARAEATENVKAMFQQMNNTSKYLDVVASTKNTKTVTIDPKINRSGTNLGDKITYTLKVNNSPLIPSFSIRFEDPSGNNDIMVVTENILSYRENGFKYQTIIVPFKTGIINFPSFNIFNYHITSATINVQSVLDRVTTINLKENYKPFNSYSDIILLLLFLLLLSAIIWAAYRYHKNKVIRQQIITPEKARNWWTELYQLFNDQVGKDDIKKYYFTSSEQLKDYITRVMGLRVSELTTYEIKMLLKQSPIKGEQDLIMTLEISDPVKFARYLPTEKEIADYQKLARNFLNANKPHSDADTNNRNTEYDNV